jgi:hypothetical protein
MNLFLLQEKPESQETALVSLSISSAFAGKYLVPTTKATPISTRIIHISSPPRTCDLAPTAKRLEKSPGTTALRPLCIVKAIPFSVPSVLGAGAMSFRASWIAAGIEFHRSVMVKGLANEDVRPPITSALPKTCKVGSKIQNVVVHPCLSSKFAKGFTIIDIGHAMAQARMIPPVPYLYCSAENGRSQNACDSPAMAKKKDI